MDSNQVLVVEHLKINFLIHEGWGAVTTIRDAINTFNIWFSSCHCSLDEVGEAQRLDNAIEKNYHNEIGFLLGRELKRLRLRVNGILIGDGYCF
ncbi:hypothetical protein NC653_018897 [Populus alba x Populus x berolinensis]|uniref:Uncharacterized protein n=1 Tax=Populus alba x Populus x berolinensis TaxID=444605 RepID=A0AAD6QHH3_9ROSI|nr:hypothetical protein NC653_018897 [Populus alba x Populus x berolinensis]